MNQELANIISNLSAMEEVILLDNLNSGLLDLVQRKEDAQYKSNTERRVVIQLDTLTNLISTLSATEQDTLLGLLNRGLLNLIRQQVQSRIEGNDWTKEEEDYFLLHHAEEERRRGVARNSNTFQSVALNEIYTSVFDEMNEEFLEERYDEDFDFEAWLDEQLLFKTNSEGVGNDYLYFINHLRTAEVMELLGEVNKEVVEATGENLAMKFDTTFVATMAVWAVGHRIRENNSNPLDNEFTRMTPAEAPSDE